MNIDEYKKMAEMEEYYWWHVGRKSIITSQLRRNVSGDKIKILNVGCGTGGTVKMLEEFGEVFNVDTSEQALEFSRTRGIKNLTQVKNEVLPFENNKFDVVVALDVIEHIKNDREALLEWHRVLKPNGTLILTAPAYMWLWSEHDELLHHHRRYSLKRISEISSHFNHLKKSYIISLTLPLIAGYRFIKKFAYSNSPKTSYVILPSVINNFFINYLKLESKLLKYLNFPFGTSILLVAKK